MGDLSLLYKWKLLIDKNLFKLINFKRLLKAKWINIQASIFFLFPISANNNIDGRSRRTTDNWKTKNTIFFFRESDTLSNNYPTWKDESKDSREKSWKPYWKYRSPWPKVDYAWVDDSVPKKGSRAAPRPRAKWHRLRGWESWTRGWTTLSRFPPHSRGSPSTPWTFLLPIARSTIWNVLLRLRLQFLLDHWTQQRSLLYASSFQHLHQLPSPPLNIDHSTLWKHRAFVQLPPRFRNAGFSNRSVWLTHRRFLSNCHCKFSREISRASGRRFDRWDSSVCCPWGRYSWQIVFLFFVIYVRNT